MSDRNHLDLALLDPWNFDDGGPARKKGDSKKSHKVDPVERKKDNGPSSGLSSRDRTAWQRIWFRCSATLSTRSLNTPYQVKNVPVWSSTDLEHIPS